MLLITRYAHEGPIRVILMALSARYSVAIEPYLAQHTIGPAQYELPMALRVMDKVEAGRIDGQPLAPFQPRYFCHGDCAVFIELCDRAKYAGPHHPQKIRQDVTMIAITK